MIETTKRCSVCREDLPIEQYHRRTRVKGGYRAACKACTSAAERRVKREPRDPEGARLKARVRRATHAAIRRGDLIRQPCERCGDTHVQAHHPRYDGPDPHLTVQWLCRRHHAAEHSGWARQLEFPWA